MAEYWRTLKRAPISLQMLRYQWKERAKYKIEVQQGSGTHQLFTGNKRPRDSQNLGIYFMKKMMRGLSHDSEGSSDFKLMRTFPWSVFSLSSFSLSSWLLGFLVLVGGRGWPNPNEINRNLKWLIPIIPSLCSCLRRVYKTSHCESGAQAVEEIVHFMGLRSKIEKQPLGI